MTREEGFFKKLNSYSYRMYFPPFSIALKKERKERKKEERKSTLLSVITGTSQPLSSPGAG